MNAPRISVTLLDTANSMGKQVRTLPHNLTPEQRAIYDDAAIRCWREAAHLGVEPSAAIRTMIVRLRARGLRVDVDAAAVEALEDRRRA